MFVNTTSNTFTSGYAASTSTYMEIEPNTTYTISKRAGKTFRVATSASIPVDGGKVLYTVANHTATSITITTESTAKYLLINYYNTDNGDTAGQSVVLDSLQVEKGTTATTYEAYIKTEIYIKNSNNVYEKLTTANAVSSLIVNSTYISDVDINQCVRNGNVVRVDFRGKVKANIPNDVRLLDFAVYS